MQRIMSGSFPGKHTDLFSRPFHKTSHSSCSMFGAVAGDNKAKPVTAVRVCV